MATAAAITMLAFCHCRSIPRGAQFANPALSEVGLLKGRHFQEVL